MILASDISIGEAGVYALLGYAVVFFGIVLLMIVITAFGKYFASKDANLAAAAASAAFGAAAAAGCCPNGADVHAAAPAAPPDALGARQTPLRARPHPLWQLRIRRDCAR